MLNSIKIKKSPFIICVLMMLSCVHFSAFANSDRSLFLKAEQFLRQKDKPRYYLLKKKLTHYPLYPYLQYLEITQNFDEFEPNTIESYLNKNKGSYWAYLLKRSWVNYLGNVQDWRQYLKVYSPSSQRTQQCWYLQAKYILGNKKSALIGFNKVWVYGNSLPDACDYILKKWTNSSYATKKLYWQRINAAISNQDYSLAKYLSVKLSKNDQKFIIMWIQTISNPKKYLNNFISTYKQQVYLANAVQLIMGVFAKGYPINAAAYWDKFKQKKMLSININIKIETKIAISLARTYAKNSMIWLKRIPNKNSSDLLWKWRLRIALRWQNWQQLITWIKAMPTSLRNTNEWLYWRAQAEDKIGHKDIANKIWATLARDRSYYGFLAADKLNIPYAFNNKKSSVSNQLLKQVANYADIKAPQELYRMKRFSLANVLWRWNINSLNKYQKLAAAILSSKWHEPDFAVYAYDQSTYRNDLTGRFPMAFKQDVLSIAKRFKLDPAWVWAIMRQESRFNRNARSYVGALGLIQVMPTTAKFISQKYNLPYASANQLFDPKLNLKIGGANLNFLKSLFNNSTVLATASYNAGQGNVANWLPNNPISAAIWIETIPFKETRDYLRHILSYMTIYEHVKLGNNNFKITGLFKNISIKSKG